MQLTNLGGATAIMEHNGKRILFDPWLNEGIFHGAWCHYPPLKIGLHELGRFDYIYISHIHEDHCAPGTIQHLNKDAEVIIMDRKPNLVVEFLHDYSFKFKKVHLIKPRTPTKISDDFVVDMLTADPRHKYNFLVDSALIMNWDGFVVYNANDCPPYEEGVNYLLTTYKKINLALLPYTGGSGYPACYVNLSEEVKKKEKERINREGLNLFLETVKTLAPEYIFPFADQYAIAGSRSHLNRYMAHPPCPGFVEKPFQKAKINSELLLLNSAQTFDFKNRKKNPQEPYRHFSEKDREEYIQSDLIPKRYDYEGFNLSHSVHFDRLVQYARIRLLSHQEKDKYFPNFSYYLDVPDRKERFRIPLAEKTAQKVEWAAPLKTPYLRVSARSTLMALLLLGHISWNIADAALFLDYDRVPNKYDPEIHAFINYLRI